MYIRIQAYSFVSVNGLIGLVSLNLARKDIRFVLNL